MADNVRLNLGSADGATIATDDDGTAQHQYVKLEFGADNTQTKVQASAPLPVQIGDGTDAALVSAGGALLVDASATTQPVSNAGLTALNGAISGTEVQVDVVGALPAGTNAIGKLAANSGVDIGDVDVTSIAAGSNLIGDVGLQPRTSGGLSFYKTIDLDESEEEVKATAGQVYSIYAFNAATTKRYLKVYNATAANVTVGTTTPDLTFVIPTDGSTGGGIFLKWPQGLAFGTAISIAATTGLADNDSGAPAANDVIVMVGYK